MTQPNKMNITKQMMLPACLSRFTRGLATNLKEVLFGKRVELNIRNFRI